MKGRPAKGYNLRSHSTEQLLLLLFTSIVKDSSVVAGQKMRYEEIECYG